MTVTSREGLKGVSSILVLVLVLVAVLVSCDVSTSERSSASRDHSNSSERSETGTSQGPAPEQDEDTVATAAPLEVTTTASASSSASSETAYDMPYLDEEHYDEGTNPDLEDDTQMYALVTSTQEGTPFVMKINAFEDFVFNARTPYYADLDDVAVNEYDHVGSGSVAAYNGNTDDAPISVELHSFAGTVHSDECYGYECLAVVSWDGPD